MVIVGVALTLLYQSAFEQQRARLIDTVKNRASLIKAVARYDQRVASQIGHEDIECDSFEATLSRLREAHDDYGGLGETGEFALARREGDQIAFLLRHRHHDHESPPLVPISSTVAEPMRLALRGESGTVIGLDYRGKMVLAAYESVAELGFGIVAKIDLSEIRAPFIRAGLISAGIAIMLILFGAMLVFRIGIPMVRDLVEKESRYRTLTNNLPVGVYRSTPEGRVISANPATLRCFGYDTLKEYLDKPAIDSYVDAECRRKLMAELREKGFVNNFESQMFRKDGSIVWISTSVQATFGDDGKIEYFDGIEEDITERKRVEKKLRESESRFDLVVQATSEGIWEWDILTNEEYFAPRWCEIIGYSHDDPDFPHTYDSWAARIHPDNYEYVMQVMKAHLEEGEIYDVDYRYRHKSGEYRWQNSCGQAVFDDHGKPVRMVGCIRDITERKRVEEALKESEERFRKLFQLTPLGYQSLDENGNFLEVNESWCQTLGYAREEVIGRNFAEFIDPNFKDIFERCFPMFKDAGAIDGVEHTMVKKDGSTIIASFVGRVGHNNDGSFKQTHCIFADVTERKQAEEALRQSEKNYRLVVDNTDTGFVVVDDAGAVVEANEPYLRLIGAEQLDDVIGRSVIEWTAPECKEDNLAAVALCVKQGYIKDFETTYVRNDGTRVMIQINAITQETSEGARLSAQCRDITERKRAEEELRESEERYRVLFEEALDAIVVTELESGIIVNCNKAATQLFGREKAELIGQHQRILHPPEETKGKFSATYEQHREEARGQILEAQIVTKNGDVRDVSIKADIFEFRGKKFLLGPFRDITETKRLQELESRAQRLETAGTIAGQVAHDFNNLLAPLMAYPDFIREGLPRNHPALAYLDYIEESAKKIADINQDLLAMGRRGHYNREVLNLNAIIHQTVKEMPSLADNVTCATVLDPDLMNILGGASQIHRVVTNLLCNAVDALQDIGHINVRTENYYVDDISGSYDRVPKGEYVKLTISDTGCGISDDNVQKILDPFFTTKASDKKRGSGLGLSVVDAVVKDHGGYLDLETKPGKGTSFYVYFPTTHESSDSQDADETCGGSERILVVDDDDMQRKVSTQLLKKLGYEVNTIESGEKAIDFLRDNPHNLVILDMVMPGGIDGAETYRQILEISPNQKTIIVSGFSESDRIRVAQELGAGAFVKKPLTKRAIANAVRTELDREVKVSV